MAIYECFNAEQRDALMPINKKYPFPC